MAVVPGRSIRMALAAMLLAGTGLTGPALAQGSDKVEANPLASLPLRNIGPAYPSGRISDFAVFPDGDHHSLVATASGGLWVTENNGTTWKPIFDSEGSYAIGVVELAPSDPDIIWVGTGENNAQRSVAAGDGVYKSSDGGKTWTNMGLKASGHISQIWIDPEDADTVIVAAQGPLWGPGRPRPL